MKIQQQPEVYFPMDTICEQFGIRRQAHYQMLQRNRQRQVQQAGILELVRQVRRKHPRMGTRKLLHKIQPMLAAEGLQIGRDRLFSLLRSQDLLVQPKKHHRRTTIPGLFRTPNLLPGLCIQQPNQVWVSDITYVELEIDRFAYLFLLMDLYSRFILGWHLASTLLAAGALFSLQMALPHCSADQPAPIHHSDHGVQYTCHDYLDTLIGHGLRPSMGAVGNCYDNIFAERVIGTLKNEYCLGDRFVDLPQLQRFVPEVVQLYNYERPHLSLDMLTPSRVYSGQAGPVQPVSIPALSEGH
jgi:putative transposase